MSKDLNHCSFIGRLGQDPEIKATQNGNTVANISLACSDDYKDKNTGQKVEQTNWIRIVAFGKLAEIVQQYVHKGSRIHISGKQVTRKWQAQDGSDRYSTEIIADNMQMLDSKQDNAPQSQGGHQQQGGYQQQSQQQQPRQQYQAPQQQNAQQPQTQGRMQPSPMANNPNNYTQQQSRQQNNGGALDDDIPFNRIDHNLA